MTRPYPLQLRSFLAEAYKTLTASSGSRPRPITLVVGNESADLDSLCSSILYAYLRSHTPPYYNLHVPLLNLPREDLSLRPEFSAVLQRAGIDSQYLATLSELEKQSDLTSEDTRWLLVDHNKMTDSLRQRFGTMVVGCVDHHVDEGSIPADTGDEPRVIEKSKSCMSLVVKYCGKGWQDLSKDLVGSGSPPDGKVLVQQLLDVALAPILVDTGNSKAQTEELAKDREALALLGDFRGEPLSESERDAYFELLLARKVAIEELSLKDIFRKDYKLWNEAGLLLGMSSIPQAPEYVFGKMAITPESLLKEYRAFAEERRLDVAVIMLSSPPDQKNSLPKRWLLVWGLNEGGAKAASKFHDANRNILGLSSYTTDVLDLQDTSKEYRHFWRMEQALHTRKQVAPMLRAAMQEVSKL